MYLDNQKLQQHMSEVLLQKGVTPEAVQHAVGSLIQTSLRGVDSHGIHLFPHYCRAVDSGRIKKNPDIKIEQTAPSVAVVDADHAFGHHAGAVAIDYATQIAKQTGIAAAVVKNSTHFGAAAYFGLRAAEQDCIGFAFTNADALVKAFGSKEAFFGTNPICFTMPLANEEPFCLDMATSLVSWNKIKNYRRNNKTVPEGWAFDENGKTVTDPHAARSLNPAGGYKGFGLGMMVDVLCAGLAGGLISKDILPMFTSPIEARRHLGHFFMVIDPSKFLNIEFFKQNMKSMVDRIRQMPMLEDQSENPFGNMMVAGDPEKHTYRIRLKEGIPVEESIFEEFTAISGAFSQTVMA